MSRQQRRRADQLAHKAASKKSREAAADQQAIQKVWGKASTDTEVKAAALALVKLGQESEGGAA